MYHIKPYLKDKGFNLSKLASKMDMSFQKFDHHIRPKEDLSFNFVMKLSAVLDMPMSEFINQVKNENDTKKQGIISN